MAMVVVGCKTGRLTAQVRWLGLRVDGCLALVYIHQMNRVTLAMICGHDDSTINIVMGIIIIMDARSAMCPCYILPMFFHLLYGRLSWPNG